MCFAVSRSITKPAKGLSAFDSSGGINESDRSVCTVCRPNHSRLDSLLSPRPPVQTCFHPADCIRKRIGFSTGGLGAGCARNPIESQSRCPPTKVEGIGAKCVVVVFRPKGPAVHIAWPNGPGKRPSIDLSGPTGRQFVSSLRRMAGPLGLEIVVLFEDLARWARLLERMARWAGNSFGSSSEFLSEKHRSQRLPGRRLF